MEHTCESFSKAFMHHLNGVKDFNNVEITAIFVLRPCVVLPQLFEYNCYYCLFVFIYFILYHLFVIIQTVRTVNLNSSRQEKRFNTSVYVYPLWAHYFITQILKYSKTLKLLGLVDGCWRKVETKKKKKLILV